MHADPHAGNLLRLSPKPASGLRAWLPFSRPTPRLAYLDFGLVSRVPVSVREGLVCAVAQLIFARNVAAVAGLFSELMLLPPDVLANPQTRRELEQALTGAASRVLKYDERPPLADGQASAASLSLPSLKFDALLGSTIA